MPISGYAAAVQLAAVHQREDARQVALVREPLQVVEQLGMLVEPRRDAHGTFGHRQRQAALLFRGLNPPLDLPDRVEILGDLLTIAGAERALQASEVWN